MGQFVTAEFGTAYADSKKTKKSLSWMDSYGANWSASTNSPRQHTQKRYFAAQQLKASIVKNPYRLRKGESALQMKLFYTSRSRSAV